MTVAARVIPCLDVTEGRVVKGVNYVDLRDAGDPVALARAYDRAGADELVFLDITASSDERQTMVDMVRNVADQVSIPFTVGGGLRSIDDARTMLHAGADKISFNSAAVRRPGLVTDAAGAFGSQSVVVAVDARATTDDTPPAVARAAWSGWHITTKGGRQPEAVDAIQWVTEVARRGAGEILLTSMDADGTKAGFDLPLLAAASRAVNVPVIASGGAGNAQHMIDAIEYGASAVLAASIFHFSEVAIADVKQVMADAGLPVRQV